MAGNPTRKGGRKNRKHGRFKLKCAAYASSHRQEKNKKRKLLRHLKKHPNDNHAESAVKAL